MNVVRRFYSTPRNIYNFNKMKKYDIIKKRTTAVSQNQNNSYSNMYKAIKDIEKFKKK